MRYGLLVIGPAGSGKSTFCNALQQHMEVLRRSCVLVNLDPAAEFFLYKPSVDVRELITVDEAAAELGLGPNGALVYAMEFLQQHLDWLEEQLLQYGEDSFFVFDCPGQIELYTHLQLMKNICVSLERAGLRLAVCCCLDISFMTDAAKLLGGSLMALSAMVQLELPHINLLTKCDLVARHLGASHIPSSSSEASCCRRRTRRRHTRNTRERRDWKKKATDHTQVQFNSSRDNMQRNTRRRSGMSNNSSSSIDNTDGCGSNLSSGNTSDSSSGGEPAGLNAVQQLQRSFEGETEQAGNKTKELQLQHQQESRQRRGDTQKHRKQCSASRGVDTSAGDEGHIASAASVVSRRTGGSASGDNTTSQEEEEEEEEEEDEDVDEEEEEEEEEDEKEEEEDEAKGEGQRIKRNFMCRAGRLLSRGVGLGMLNSCPRGFSQDGNMEMAVEKSAATPEEVAKERAIDALLSRDPQQLLQQLDECTPAAYRNLNAAFAALLEDYSLVSFLPCDITEEDSLSAVALALEQTLQYGEDLEVRETDILPPD